MGRRTDEWTFCDCCRKISSKGEVPVEVVLPATHWMTNGSRKYMDVSKLELCPRCLRKLFEVVHEHFAEIVQHYDLTVTPRFEVDVPKDQKEGT